MTRIAWRHAFLSQQGDLPESIEIMMMLGNAELAMMYGEVPVFRFAQV